MKSMRMLGLLGLLVVSVRGVSHAEGFSCTDPKDPSTCIVPSTTTAQCAGFTVLAQNRTDQKLAGYISSFSDNIQLSGFTMDPYDLKYVPAFPQNSADGTVYRVTGSARLADASFGLVTCETDIPSLNGCPDPSAQATIVFFNNGGSLSCRMFTTGVSVN